MGELMDSTAGELARENFSYIQFFIQHHVDFYCHGKSTLREVLAESGIPEESVKQELDAITSMPSRDYRVNIDQWPLDLLADYIQKTHHRYTEKTIGTLKTMVDDYLQSHPEQLGNIKSFQSTLAALTRELAVHMKKEELMLFPFIRKMAASRGGADASLNKPMNGQIDMLTHEHETQHQLLTDIRKLFNSYEKDSDDEAANKIMGLMKELDHDLALHLHLENNILFPDTLKLQAKLAPK